MDVKLAISEDDEPRKQPKKKIDGSKHPFKPKAEQPSIAKNEDGSWGPTGLYGRRVKETKVITMLRSVVKASRLERIEKVLSARSKRVQCLFENLSDAANGAACLRTMEAMGVLEGHAVESYEPFTVQGGITMNAEKWMSVQKYRHCLDAATALKQRGFTLVATCLDEDAVPLNAVDFTAMEKICVMFGNEERGLSFALRQAADVKVYIPMSGFSQSFNISVSCAITLYHLGQAGVIVPDLSDEEIAHYYLKWLIMSTKRSATLLKKHNFEQTATDYI